MSFKPPEIPKTPDKKLSVEDQANYKGDWTLLLRERLLDPITKAKFIKTKQEEIKWMQKSLTNENKETINIEINKILDQINDYDSMVEKVFSYTKISTPVEDAELHLSIDEMSGESSLGYSYGWGDTGTIRSYDTNDDRKKNIFESHEKVHGIVRVSHIDNLEDMFDPEEMSMELDGAYEGNYERGVEYEQYLKNPNEIMASLSQLKNYFGMKAKDIFTKEHFKYAQKNYHGDIDESGDFTATFLHLLKRENNTTFLEIMNSYPI